MLVVQATLKNPVPAPERWREALRYLTDTRLNFPSLDLHPFRTTARKFLASFRRAPKPYVWRLPSVFFLLTSPERRWFLGHIFPDLSPDVAASFLESHFSQTPPLPAEYLLPAFLARQGSDGKLLTEYPWLASKIVGPMRVCRSLLPRFLKRHGPVEPVTYSITYPTLFLAAGQEGRFFRYWGWLRKKIREDTPREDVRLHTRWAPWFDMGNQLAKQDRPSLALAAYRRAADLDTGFASGNLYLKLIRLFLEQGRLSDARAGLDVALNRYLS